MRAKKKLYFCIIINIKFGVIARGRKDKLYTRYDSRSQS